MITDLWRVDDALPGAGLSDGRAGLRQHDRTAHLPVAGWAVRGSGRSVLARECRQSCHPVQRQSGLSQQLVTGRIGQASARRLVCAKMSEERLNGSKSVGKLRRMYTNAFMIMMGSEWVSNACRTIHWRPDCWRWFILVKPARVPF